MRKSKDSRSPARDSSRAEQEADLPKAIPYPVSAISVSGLYRLSQDQKLPIVQRSELAARIELAQPQALSREPGEQEYLEPELYEASADLFFGGGRVREELRLDVDGPYPQMTASGTITRWLSSRIDWIAKLKPTGRFGWSGQIWYKNGAAQLFPYTTVAITVSRSLHAHQRRATVLFSGGGAPNRLRAFRYHSAFFREVSFEFDSVEGIAPITAIETDAHPNRPAALPAETLSIDTVFRRAGFRATSPADAGRVPIAGAGADALWNDMELHDAMQAYWSKFTARAQWSFWTFFAARHELGPSLGGIMFDDIGPNHRQGAALFYDSFISQAPAGDANGAAWVDRMRFWTAVHEMGHAFNLAHSWQKSLIANGDGPWIPLSDEPEARSFMNYPFAVSGGQTAFFEDFEFRFSDSELLFLRHAPEKFVQMGNAAWFDDHGFQQVTRSAEPPLRLELRVNRDAPTFEFLEPVVLELKLTNISEQPQLLPDDLLTSSDRLTIVIRRQGQPARSFLPFAQYCRKPGQSVLRTGQSVYESLFVAAGRGGWQLAEPGNYTVQVCLHLDDEDIVSNALALRIAPPAGRDEEVIAQDFFSDDVGRVLAFDGSRHFEKANDVLLEVAAHLPKRRVASHARVALFLPSLSETKQLDLKGELPRIIVARGDWELASANLEEVLGESSEAAAETLGHIDYTRYLDRFSSALEADGSALAVQSNLSTLKQARQTLQQRGVLQEVVDAVDSRIRLLDRRTKAA